MRYLWLVVLTVMLSVRSVSAGPITPCSGSWDGAGLSACELMGQPGEIGAATAIDFAQFTLFGPVWEITAYDATNTLTVLPSGALRYQPRADVDEVFTSNGFGSHQFAIWWMSDDEVWVGVEDLTAGDFDYNDYIVRFVRPELPPPPPPVTAVPESTPTWLLLVGLAALGLFRYVSR